MPSEFLAAPILDQLRDFQRRSVEHGFRRLFQDPDSSRRFLVADETGLGKTHVARGIIAKTIEKLQHDERVRRIDIIYVCSNLDIADQNLRKLAVTGDAHASPATRLTMLVAQPDLLNPDASSALKPVSFISFTPGTSLDMGSQTGRAEERAVLYLLLAEFLGTKGARDTALRRILQGGISSLDRFGEVIERSRPKYGTDEEGAGWQPNIWADFEHALRTSKLLTDLLSLIDQVVGRSGLTQLQAETARDLTVQLRRLLARSSMSALEPDLIILDEFQRFSHLLVSEEEGQSDASELAQQLFRQPDARVLLLSATPYKPFTLAAESIDGENHYRDFIKTLEFLDNSFGSVPLIEQDLAQFRRALLSGNDATPIRDRLQNSLTRLLTRQERPSNSADGAHVVTICRSGEVRPGDFAGFALLHRIARHVDAPVSVEYWKSAPYFVNFLDGYKIGERVKAALANKSASESLQPLLIRSQHLKFKDVKALKPIDLGNTRLRELARDTVGQGWWRLLWMPGSLPYYKPSGAYAEFADGRITKRLIFSSWFAAPSAIASLLSYEAHRHISAVSEPGSDSRHQDSIRLQYRMDGKEPASMTTLMLFWPNPSLAHLTDPLGAAASFDDVAAIDSLEIIEWAESKLRPVVGDSGTSTVSASTNHIWTAAIRLQTKEGQHPALGPWRKDELSSTFFGSQHSVDEVDESSETSPQGLSAHLELALALCGGFTPDLDSDRPLDFLETLALIGVASPANVAWRSLRRIAGPGVSDRGLWKAAVHLAIGFRSLFNRPESTHIIDMCHKGNREAYWRSVLRYCLDGNLQAVMDEYLHHLSASESLRPDNDELVMKLATAAAQPLGLRAATYSAKDVEVPDRHIQFLSRFALRFGNARQEQDDVRLPEVRAAFNSPFWPFVLASTSIGQEGVDFHWWCHAIVHWNLPPNPVDFEQREGRVNRYMGHAIRKNVALAMRNRVLKMQPTDPWRALFSEATHCRDSSHGDLVPYWVYAGPHRTERYLYEFPLSKDQSRWSALKETLVMYRLAYGQPRQEDLIEILGSRGLSMEGRSVESMVLKLEPPRIF